MNDSLPAQELICNIKGHSWGEESHLVHECSLCWKVAEHKASECQYCPDGKSCKCSAAPAEDHTCPFAEEIRGDYTTMCNCCTYCTRQCAWDV